MMRSYILLLTVIIFSCSSEPQEFIYDYSPWVERIDTLQFNLEGSGIDEIYNYVTLRSNGDTWIIYDWTHLNFAVFDSGYNFTGRFGAYGRGPREFGSYTGIYHSENGDTYIYDRSNSKIITYSNDSYEEAIINISGIVLSFAVDEHGNTLFYHLSSGSDHVLSLYNKEGDNIREFFVPDDNEFKLFMSRFRHGNLQYKASTGKFYFMYSDGFDIYEINTDGVITDTLSFTSKSMFNKKVNPFPANLDPFRMDEAHWNYITASYLPFRFYFLGENHILFESLDAKMEAEPPVIWERFYSLFTLDGRPVFEGLKFDVGEYFELRQSLPDGSVVAIDDDILMRIYFKK